MSTEPRPSERAADVVAVVALSVVALLGLDDSFADRSYLVTGMAAVLVVTGWALMCAVQRYPAGVFLLVVSLAFPVLGATVVMHNYDWLGFPAPRAMGDVLTAALTAPGEFLTTIPPVDAHGAVLAIPYVVGFVLCGPSAWVALRSRRPLAPAVPLVAAMVVCIVLGTEQPRHLLVRGSLFAAGVVLWATARAARLGEVQHDSRGRALRAVAGTVLAVGSVLLAAGWLPAVPHQDRVVLRGRVGTGQDVSQLDNPLASFRKYTSQPRGTADNVHDARLLRVTGLPDGVPLRYVALDVYDGTGWVTGNRTVPDDSSAIFQRIGDQVGAPRPGRPARVGVQVERPWSSSWLPVAGHLTGLSFDYLDGRAQRSDVRYDVATQTAMVVGGLQGGDDYHFTSRIPVTALTRSMPQYGDGSRLQPAGGYLDTYLQPWRTSGLSRMQQVFSLARYLRTNGRYSDGGKRLEQGYLPGQSPQRLGPGFIGAHTIVGDDEQYAAFMALAANRLGVPARVVVGALPERQGWVRGRDVLAWVEVRVADGSWRTLATGRFMSHRPPAHAGVPQTPESYVRSTTRDQASRPPQQQARPPQLPPARAAAALHPWTAAIALLLVLLAGLVPAAKLARRRVRSRRGSPSARFVAGWTELLDLERDLGREVALGLARTEQARRLGISLALARGADLHVFAREEPSAQDAAAFWAAVHRERRRLLHEAGVVRRVLAWWAPASLVSSIGTTTRRWRRAAPRGRRSHAERPATGG
ncbi:MAG: transglutaminase domain-containing protein [Marmoricola sp.]|nr:transglutaminase domain-containing protein [Marmoricola sp.]